VNTKIIRSDPHEPTYTSIDRLKGPVRHAQMADLFLTVSKPSSTVMDETSYAGSCRSRWGPSRRSRPGCLLASSTVPATAPGATKRTYLASAMPPVAWLAMRKSSSHDRPATDGDRRRGSRAGRRVGGCAARSKTRARPPRQTPGMRPRPLRLRRMDDAGRRRVRPADQARVGRDVVASPPVVRPVRKKDVCSGEGRSQNTGMWSRTRAHSSTISSARSASSVTS
jgi:hypothetical protein